MSENSSVLSNPRWIGNGSISHEDIYMSDGSYVQVANEMYPGKVSWPGTNVNNDHSAITTSQSGVFISKWGNKPWMEHDWDDQPYGTTGLKYYVSTDISGSSSVLCNNSTRNFSTKNIPNADYDWAVGPGITLNDDGEYSTSVTAGSSYSGETWIEVEITSPLGGDNEDVKISKRIVFWVGKPNPDHINYINIGPNYPYSYVLCDDMPNDGKVEWTNSLGGISEYSWSVYDDCNNDWQVIQHPMEPYPLVPMLDVQFSKPQGSVCGWVNVIVKARNQCGWGQYKLAALQFSTAPCGGGGWYMSVSPNPSNGMVTVSVENKLKTDNIEIEEKITWVLDIYNINRTQVKERINMLNGSSTTINTSGWAKGIYIVQAQYKDKVLQAKLVVE